MNKPQASYAKAFTIVELLIVIVVIAILAAISIVAYTGIQNSANDAAVQSDIRNFAMKVREFEVLEGRFPAGNGSAAVEGIGSFSLSRSSYDTTRHNFFYCRGIVSGQDRFGVGAVSASGNGYFITSGSGAVQISSWNWPQNPSNGTVCPGLLGIATSASSYSYSFGYNRSSTTWNAWTQ